MRILCFLLKIVEMKYSWCLFILVVLVSENSFAQSNYAQINSDYYHTVDRYQLLSDSGFSELHTSFKPYRQGDIARTISRKDSSKVGQYNQTIIEGENRFYLSGSVNKSDKPFLKRFYEYKNDAYSVNEADFKLSVNPVLYVGGGVEQNATSKLYANSRGVEVDGLIDNKVGFYANFIENQEAVPSFVVDRRYGYGAVDGQNFWKPFKDNGFDFFTAKGYITFNATKHIDVQFGYDKNAVGNGYRSLILSDNSGNYTFLKLRTKVWKFQYTNLFAELNSDVFGDAKNVPLGNTVYPKKFLALHHLSLNVTKRLNIGLFESVVYGRGNNSFDVNYMNPIIFYRAIEGNLGSDGNVLLGADLNWNLARGLALYGQFVLDEFRIDHFRAKDGWWGNKYGVQGGLKYINALGIKNLDLQGEVNIVRPYTYTHRIKETSYTHYNQALAHPLGANFREVIGIARYQPIKKLTVTATMMVAQTSVDTLNGAVTYFNSPNSSNWGNNIFLPNTSREQELNNTIAQGSRTTITNMVLRFSYQLKQGLFVDWNTGIRNQTFDLPIETRKSTYTQLSLRWNIAYRAYVY